MTFLLKALPHRLFQPTRFLAVIFQTWTKCEWNFFFSKKKTHTHTYHLQTPIAESLKYINWFQTQTVFKLRLIPYWKGDKSYSIESMWQLFPETSGWWPVMGEVFRGERGQRLDVHNSAWHHVSQTLTLVWKQLFSSMFCKPSLSFPLPCQQSLLQVEKSGWSVSSLISGKEGRKANLLAK